MILFGFQEVKGCLIGLSLYLCQLDQIKMGILTFFITFTLLILLSSVFIVGFFQLTRHWKVTEPDGKITTEGDLLKFWSVYWEQVLIVKRVYYKDDSLEFKFNELNRLLPKVGENSL